MEQTTLKEETRTGIYVQESAGVTTAGDGLAPQGDKSPVTKNNHSTIIRSNDSSEDIQNCDRSQSSICEENKTFDESNPFKRSISQVHSISENESDEKTLIYTLRQCKFRKARNKEMSEKFSELGFSKQEIKVMQDALEEERKKRHNENKFKRFCEETQLEPETLKLTWLERKERELAKFRAEKAAKIAAGTFNPIPFRERKLQEKNRRILREEQMRDKIRQKKREKKREREGTRSPGLKELAKWGSRECTQIDKLRRTVDRNQLLVSPGILAGQTEDASPNTFKNKKKFAEMERSSFAGDREYEDIRRKMNLGDRHMMCISPSDLSLRIPKIKELDPYTPNLKFVHRDMVRNILQELNNKYPVKARIIDRSNPYGQILGENQSLLLDALETTIKDERALGAHWIKVGPFEYKQKMLNIRCKNDETRIFLESKMSFYNCLWPGADLFLDLSDITVKRMRHKIKVDIPNYNLTSQEFLKVIKKQNGYRTEFWDVYYKNEHIRSFWAIIAVDPDSYERLVESEGFVYFFFDRIAFDLNPQKPKK